MKKILITPLLFLFCLTALAQNPMIVPSKKWDFAVSSKHSNSIKKEKLNTVKSLEDIMPDYPVSWINSYISIELIATHNGSRKQAYSTNTELTAEQIALLANADISSDVVINIAYTSANAVSGEMEKSIMNYSTTLVPDTEAEYPTGYEQLTKYLNENVIDKIAEEKSKLAIVRALVKFTVNEQGEIADAQVSRSSGDQNIDNLLLETITKMPKWKPAQNSKGENVKQGFEFSLNSPNQGGC